MSTFDIKKFLINEGMTRVSRDRKRLLKEWREIEPKNSPNAEPWDDAAREAMAMLGDWIDGVDTDMYQNVILELAPDASIEKLNSLLKGTTCFVLPNGNGDGLFFNLADENLNLTCFNPYWHDESEIKRIAKAFRENAERIDQELLWADELSEWEDALGISIKSEGENLDEVRKPTATKKQGSVKVANAMVRIQM